MARPRKSRPANPPTPLLCCADAKIETFVTQDLVCSRVGAARKLFVCEADGPDVCGGFRGRWLAYCHHHDPLRPRTPPPEPVYVTVEGTRLELTRNELEAAARAVSTFARAKGRDHSEPARELLFGWLRRREGM